MQKWKRMGMALCGVIIVGFCVSLFQKANLGADPFTCFVTGIANILHSNYSVVYPIVTGILLVAVFFVERHYIGIATVFNLLGTGTAAGIMSHLLNQWFPEPSMIIRVGLMLLGILGTCFAASLYFTADLGVSAYDALSLIAANKYKITAFKICRIASDSICVIIGCVFHVTIGVGTVITALFMGPVVQWFNTNVSEPFLYGFGTARDAVPEKNHKNIQTWISKKLSGGSFVLDRGASSLIFSLIKFVFDMTAFR